MMTDERYRDKAKRQYEDEGRVEIDHNATVSHSGDGGAYVQAWVWVYDDDEEEAETHESLAENKEPHKEITRPCPQCGRKEYNEQSEQTVWYTPCPSDDCPQYDPKETRP